MTTHYSEKKDLFPLEGGCVCGLIRYSLTLAPLLVHCCWCTACQRQTGTAFALNAIIESSALKLLPSASPPDAAGILPSFACTASATSALDNPPAAEPVAVCIPTESGRGQIIVQCPACRTTLWNHYADAGNHLTYLRVGTLDRPWEVQPDVHIYTKSRASYLKIVDGKPEFEEYYSDRNEFLRPGANERVEVLREVIKRWKVETFGKARTAE